MGVKGLTHYLCQSTIASRDVSLETFALDYKKQHNRQPLLVFDGESFWHVLHGSNLPRIFGGQFIQFRKKAEDFCKRLTTMGFRLAFIFGNSPISAETKAEERGKQTLLHLTSFYRQLNEKSQGLPAINEIWPPCLRNVFPYYLRSLPGITVLQSLMDKDLSIACYAKDNKAAAIVSNDSDMLIFAVCPVMVARGLNNGRNRVVMMYPDAFCEDVGLSVERLPLLSVYLGNTETPITTNVVEASDGVIQRKIKAGDRGNVQDAIEYVRNLEAPISIEELARDIFQEVDAENIDAVRISMGRYILRERDYEFDVSPLYKKVKDSPMIEPVERYDVDKSDELSLFLEKIKKPVIQCDIILKAKAWRREFNIMHMSWPVPGCGIPNPEKLYGPIFAAHAYLLGKKQHLMIIPRFEEEPLKLAEPAFRNITLKPANLSLPDGTKMPDAHELWVSQDKRLQVTALVTIWDATDLDFETLMGMVPATLCFLLVLHWVRRRAGMKDWEVYAFLATHVRMRHFTCDQIWRMDDIIIAKGITCRSIVLANVFSKLIGRFLWMVSLCGSPFKTVDLLPDLMFDGMIFQKKYEQARLQSEDGTFDMTTVLDAVCSLVALDSRKDRERVLKLFAVLNSHRVPVLPIDDSSDRCSPVTEISMDQEYEPNWYAEWSGNRTKTLRRKSTPGLTPLSNLPSSQAAVVANIAAVAAAMAPPTVPQVQMAAMTPHHHHHHHHHPVQQQQQAHHAPHHPSHKYPSHHHNKEHYHALRPMPKQKHTHHLNHHNPQHMHQFHQNPHHRSAPVNRPPSRARVPIGTGRSAHDKRYESYQLSRKERPLSTSDYSEQSHYTEDPGYHTAGTNLSRSSTNLHQLTRHEKQSRNSDSLSFSAALASKCNESSYSTSPLSQEDPDDVWGAFEEPKRIPRTTAAGPRERKDSWGLDEWEEIEPTPREREPTKYKSRGDPPPRVEAWKHQNEADWRDVPKNDGSLRLNFFSNAGWPNSQADECDLGAQEWTSGHDRDDHRQHGLPKGHRPNTEKFSYAQAAGAKEQKLKDDWNAKGGFCLRNDAREFVPQSSRATSRSPSEATASEYDGYQSDIPMSYRATNNGAYRGAYTTTYPTAYGYQRTHYAYHHHQRYASSPHHQQPPPRQVNQKHPHDPHQDLNSNDQQVIDHQLMGEYINTPPHHGHHGHPRRVVVQDVSMQSVPSYGHLTMLQQPLHRPAPRMVQPQSLIRLCLVTQGSPYIPNYKLQQPGP